MKIYTTSQLINLLGWNNLINELKDILSRINTSVSSIFTDAPSDGKIYGRKDGEWEKTLEIEDITYDDRVFEAPGTRDFQIEDKTKYLLCFGGEVLTLNESVINFPLNSLLQFRVLDSNASLQIVGTLCFYLNGATPITSVDLFAGNYCELKKISSGNWVLTIFNKTVRTTDDFLNDGAAAAGGVLIGGQYHTSGTLKIRLI